MWFHLLILQMNKVGPEETLILATRSPELNLTEVRRKAHRTSGALSPLLSLCAVLG